MEAKTKKRVIIWTSVAAILGVGGYFLYKYLKDSGKIGGKKDDEGKTETTTTTSVFVYQEKDDMVSIDQEGNVTMIAGVL